MGMKQAATINGSKKIRLGIKNNKTHSKMAVKIDKLFIQKFLYLFSI